jgi:hypothetical protein
MYTLLRPWHNVERMLMMRRPALHPGYERLVGAAATDPTLGRALLRDPRATALGYGLRPDEADLVADIRAADLRTFAALLLPRLYGKDGAREFRRSAAAS